VSPPKASPLSNAATAANAANAATAAPIAAPIAATGPLAGPKANVAARDFAQPLRLDGATLEEIGRRLQRALPTFEAALRPSLGEAWSVTLERVGEANARRFFAETKESRVVAFFRLQGAPSSIAWRTSAAAAAVDAVLGSSSPPASSSTGPERPLSRVEARLAGDLLLALAQAAAKALGLSLSDFELLTEEAAIRMRVEDLRDADPHRLEVDLGLRGPSELAAPRFHIGGLRPEAAPTPPAVTAVPGHLDAVELEIRARLGDGEIPLSQVLGLEPGDVIPISALPALACISVEGRNVARARLGTHQGRLALRIETLLAD
jgi:flagellar motor switch protein FliM